MTLRPCSATLALWMLLPLSGLGAELLPLKDGNFEAWQRNVPTAWKVDIGASSGGSVRSQVLPIEGGGVQLSGNALTGAWQILSQRLEVAPGAMLRVKFNSRTEGLKREARQNDNCFVGLMAFDAGGKRLAFQVRNLFETDWAPGQCTMQTPAGTSAVDVVLFLSKTGSLQARSVELERMEAIDSFDVLVDEIDRYYSFLAMKKFDWRARAATYAADARGATSADQFAKAIQPLLAELKDLHVLIETAGGERIPTCVSAVQRNFDARTIAGKLKDVKQVGRMGFTARTEDGFGYVAIGTLAADEKTSAEMLAAFDALLDAPGLIIDLRPNAGGSEPVAQQFVGRLVDQPLKYASNQFRNGAKHADLVILGTRQVHPHGKKHYAGPVVGLIGPGCVSSGEGFALMLKALPRAKLIGLPTRGASGNPQPVLLPNGLKVHYSTWVPLQLDGQPFEGQGIAPAQQVDEDPSGAKALDAAIAMLRESTKK